MTAPILDHILSVAHDAGVAAGAAVTDLSEGAIDAFHSFDADRVADLTASIVGGAVGTASQLKRRVGIRNMMIGLGIVAAVAIVITLITRSQRKTPRPAERISDDRVSNDRVSNDRVSNDATAGRRTA